jgi:CelD/BcsL family acetyltransferase involved in cellulose biosynthesis
MIHRPLTLRVASDFESLGITPDVWNDLLLRGETRTIFLTRWWQRTWWESFGRGDLLLILVERNGHPVLLAPLFCDQGMVFFVGSGGSDYLDFLGPSTDLEALALVLAAARDNAPGFLGFRLYHVPDTSATGSSLRRLADELDLSCFDEGSLPAPVMEITPDSANAVAAANKKSLVRHERSLARDGTLAFQHLRRAEEIHPCLPAFFQQHIDRWAVTPHPSLFRDPVQRSFYERLTLAADEADCLRFARVDWNGQGIAFHFGFNFLGSYLWYKPSFEIGLARRSPGEVLLRHLLLAAVAEGARLFDFGIGDEAFKQRFATRVTQVRTWGLYPK